MKMNKQNLWLLINTGIILLITALFILASESLIPKTPADLLFGKVVELKNQTDIEVIPTSSSYAVVDYKEDVYVGSKKISTLYNLKIRNSYRYSDDYDFGYIELLVSIDKAGKVKVQIVELNQSDWTVKGIQAYVYDKYQGIPFGNVSGIPAFDAADPTAGATATDSTGTIKALIQKTVEIHNGTYVDDPYIAIYGEDYSLTPDETFTPTANITAKKIAKNASNEVVGYVYYLTGIGDYYDDYAEEMHTGHGIGLEVVFDASYEVLDIFVPEDQYEHTSGFRNNILNYVKKFVGKSPADFLSTMEDPVAGASYTGDLVNILLNALIEGVN